jgi:hypothetical protein
VFHALSLLVVLCCRNLAAAPPLPDFVIESVELLPSVPTSGLPVTVTATIRNRGTASGDARKLDVWLNRTNATPPVMGEVGDLWCQAGELAPGESRVVTPLPQRFLAAGTNRLCAWVEFENLVAETCNTNNHFCMDYYAESELALLRPVYRFWSPVFSAHFYTISEREKDKVVNQLSQYWDYEGVAYYAYPVPVPGTVPLYRFWSPVFSGHFFTTSERERDKVVNTLSQYWDYEGVAYYVHPSQTAGTAPVYRFWSPVFSHHFYTISEREQDKIINDLAQYWTYEIIAFYAFPEAASGD